MRIISVKQFTVHSDYAQYEAIPRDAYTQHAHTVYSIVQITLRSKVCAHISISQTCCTERHYTNTNAVVHF